MRFTFMWGWSSQQLLQQGPCWEVCCKAGTVLHMGNWQWIFKRCKPMHCSIVLLFEGWHIKPGTLVSHRPAETVSGPVCRTKTLQCHPQACHSEPVFSQLHGIMMPHLGITSSAGTVLHCGCCRSLMVAAIRDVLLWPSLIGVPH